MSKPVRIEYTETFLQTLDSAISHYRQWSDEIATIERIEQIVEWFESSVGKNPLSHSLCGELVELGVTQIRHALKEDFRLLFVVASTPTETVITALLFLSQKQSIQNQLIQHCLIYK